jgi:type IV pilus assembly protein PilQ
MRLKQLLGIITLLLVVSLAAAAAGSQLTKVSVASQGSATTVTLHASGAFTHNEYRPADNLLLVDLTGVTAGKFSERATPLKAPGVKSYRVMGYTGAAGKKITRFELTLAPGAAVQLAPVAGGLAIHVGGTEEAAAAVAKAAAPLPVAPEKASATRGAAAPHAVVRNIAVVRGKQSLDIEIAISGVVEPKALKLADPDRLVVDLANAVPGGRARTITVNSGGVKTIRMARYQLDPPVTRVVVDLVGARDYELAPAGHKVILKIRTPEQPVAAAPAKPPVQVAHNAPPAAESALAAMAKPTAPGPQPAPAQPVVLASNVVMPEAAVSVKPASPEAVASLKEVSAQPGKVETGTLPPPAPARQPAVNLAQEQRQQMAAPTPTPTPKYTGEPISVNLKDVDLRDFFRLIHEISGLNIVLDPNVRGSLTLVLDDVPWDQALDIVLKNNGLERQLEGNVLRIATVETITKEADARREQAEKQALAVDKVTVTRFLSYAHSADVVATVKKFLSQRGDVIADPRTNALIIQDIPAVIPQIDGLLQQLDRKTQQVQIEARVVAATRSFARDIGTQLGFGWGNGATAVGGANLVGNSPVQQIGIADPRYFIVGTSQIPLFTNFAAGTGANPPTSGLTLSNASRNYRLDAILTMAESRGLLKILSRPYILTQNNIPSWIRQGLRVPIVTQGQLSGPATTTYTDAFLRMTVTPQITAENTIFLNLDLENTTPDFSRVVGGNPTLITQQAQTSVLVTDGGTVVIGGVIQTQNSVSTVQVPLLGDIPILGNLFKRNTVSTSTQELIFFIMPKIIQT